MFNGMNETYQETMTLEPPKYGELFEYLKFRVPPKSSSSSSPPKYHFQQIPNFLEKSLNGAPGGRCGDRSAQRRLGVLGINPIVIGMMSLVIL